MLKLGAALMAFLPALGLTAALLQVTPPGNVGDPPDPEKLSLKEAIGIANGNNESDVIELGGSNLAPVRQ